MDPLSLLILAGVGDLVGGLVSAYGASAARDKAREILSQAGDISPDAIRKAGERVLGPTEFNKIALNPAYQTAQDKSLAALNDLADHGGLNLTDKAALNDVENSVNANESRARRAVLDNMAARGMGNSGMALAAQLDAQQADANRLNSAGLNIAGAAQRRALDAILQRASLAGRMQDADYGRQADRARAQDAINALNGRMRYQSRLDARQAALEDAGREAGWAADPYNRVGGAISGASQGVAQVAAQRYLRDAFKTPTETPETPLPVGSNATPPAPFDQSQLAAMNAYGQPSGGSYSWESGVDPSASLYDAYSAPPSEYADPSYRASTDDSVSDPRYRRKP